MGVAIVFCAISVGAQECDVVQLVLENPNSYTKWMMGHIQKPDCNTMRYADGHVTSVRVLFSVGRIFVVPQMT